VLKRHYEVSNASVTREQTVLTLAQAHSKLGHTDVEKTRRTAKALGWKLKDGVMEPCASCASGKAKQRRVPKKSERARASRPGERWYHDISTISDKEGVSCPKKQWHLQHDEYSRYSITNFYKHKDDFIEPMCAFLRKLSDKGMAAEYIRMDNSGETRAMCNAACMSDRVGILLANEILSYSTNLGNLVLEKDR